ncbi:MAG TPA: ABC transporter ATP-binding protein [Devosiaceae bacterium]|jgi:ABC-type Fe3+/spermidine/putrescine transport system ATPase subunit
MTGVSLRKMVKKYGNVTAVDGIDLTIGDGELVVLLGPSGCGKTTTLRCIAGLEDISDGEIVMGDKIASSGKFALPPEKREIGMVFQSYAIWPHMSVADNVAFGLNLKRLPQNEIKERVATALDLVGLTAFKDRGTSQISGGQQQRVALARAIVMEPKVLLFDEPLSNLDAKLRERMRFELRQLQKRLGITAIYVTHDQQEAMAIADRIVLMNGGKIAQIGSPEELYQRPVTHFGAEFVGLANIIKGEVIETGVQTLVKLDTGRLIATTQNGFAPGARVEAVFRPENVEILAQPSGDTNVYEAEVTSCYYLGNISDVFLTAGGVPVRAQLSPARKYPEGEKVWLRVDPATVVLIGE